MWRTKVAIKVISLSWTSVFTLDSSVIFILVQNSKNETLFTVFKLAVVKASICINENCWN